MSGRSRPPASASTQVPLHCNAATKAAMHWPLLDGHVGGVGGHPAGAQRKRDIYADLVQDWP